MYLLPLDVSPLDVSRRGPTRSMLPDTTVLKEQVHDEEVFSIVYLVREPGGSIGTNFGSKAHSYF